MYISDFNLNDVVHKILVEELSNYLGSDIAVVPQTGFPTN